VKTCYKILDNFEMHRVINWCQQFLLNIPRSAPPDTQPNGRQGPYSLYLKDVTSQQCMRLYEQ